MCQALVFVFSFCWAALGSLLVAMNLHSQSGFCHASSCLAQLVTNHTHTKILGAWLSSSRLVMLVAYLLFYRSTTQEASEWTLPELGLKPQNSTIWLATKVDYPKDGLNRHTGLLGQNLVSGISPHTTDNRVWVWPSLTKISLKINLTHWCANCNQNSTTIVRKHNA